MGGGVAVGDTAPTRTVGTGGGGAGATAMTFRWLSGRTGRSRRSRVRKRRGRSPGAGAPPRARLQTARAVGAAGVAPCGGVVLRGGLTRPGCTAALGSPSRRPTARRGGEGGVRVTSGGIAQTARAPQQGSKECWRQGARRPAGKGGTCKPQAWSRSSGEAAQGRPPHGRRRTVALPGTNPTLAWRLRRKRRFAHGPRRGPRTLLKRTGQTGARRDVVYKKQRGKEK